MVGQHKTFEWIIILFNFFIQFSWCGMLISKSGMYNQNNVLLPYRWGIGGPYLGKLVTWALRYCGHHSVFMSFAFIRIYCIFVLLQLLWVSAVKDCYSLWFEMIAFAVTCHTIWLQYFDLDRYMLLCRRAMCLHLYEISHIHHVVWCMFEKQS